MPLVFSFMNFLHIVFGAFWQYTFQTFWLNSIRLNQSDDRWCNKSYGLVPCFLFLHELWPSFSSIPVPYFIPTNLVCVFRNFYQHFHLCFCFFLFCLGFVGFLNVVYGIVLHSLIGIGNFQKKTKKKENPAQTRNQISFRM